MGVTVLPYIDQTQTARLQETASANIQTPKNTDEAVTTFKECLASAERSVQAMAVDALLAASSSGAVSLDTVQQILGFTPQTDAPVDTSPVAYTPAISSSSATNSTASSGSVSSPENLEEYFKEASETYGVDINLLKAIAKADRVVSPQSNEFIRQYNLPSASSVKTALTVLVDKDLVYHDDSGYTVYDRFLNLWLKQLV